MSSTDANSPAVQASRLRERIEKRALVLSLALPVLAALCFWGGSLAWREAESYRPRFEMILEMEAPAKAESVEIYLNADWDRPWHFIVEPGVATYTLPDIPAQVSTLRLDPGRGKGVEVRVRSIRFATSPGYRPVPGRTLAVLDTSTWQGWGVFNLKVLDQAGGLLILTGAPMLTAAPNLHLRAMLGTVPEPPLFLKAAVGGCAAAGLAALLALAFVLWVMAERRPGLGKALAIGLAALAGWGLTVGFSFPGFTNFDEWYSLNEFYAGLLSDIHPPLQPLIWVGLIRVFQTLGLSSLLQFASQLLVQATVFWGFAAALAAAFRRTWLGVVFLLFLAVFPPMLGYLGHIGKDTIMGLFFFVALVALRLSRTRRSLGWLLLGAGTVFLGYSVRTNGPVAALPLCLLVTVTGLEFAGWGGKPRRGWIVAGGAVILFALLFGANWWVYKAAVTNRCCLGHAGFTTFVHDMMGISYRIRQNLIKPYLYSVPDYSLDHILKTYEPPNTVNYDGLTRLGPEVQGQVLRDWIEAVRAHPREYLEHRLAVNRYFFGYTREPNPYALFIGFAASASLPGLLATEEGRRLIKDIDPSSGGAAFRSLVLACLSATRDGPLFRPWIYVVFYLTTLLFLGGSGRGEFARMSRYAWWSGLLYFLPYIPLTSSASFRYFWWSLLAVVLVFFLRLGDSLDCAEPWNSPGPRGTLARLIPRAAYTRDGRLKGLGLPPDVLYFTLATGLLLWLGELGLGAG